jgi:hypothetical protein
MSRKKRKRTFVVKKEVKAIARERVGMVKPSRPIPPRTARKKPKYKKPLEEDGDNLG